MAVITSNGTGGGQWSATATWVGAAVPVNADSVVLAAADEVVFDVDQSGFAAGIAGMTEQVGAKLVVDTSAGTYYLKTSAPITGVTGSTGMAYFEAGNLTTVLPSNVDFKMEYVGVAGTQLFQPPDEAADCELNVLVCDAKGPSEDANRHAALTSACESAAVLALRENIDALEVGDTVEIYRAYNDGETGVVASIDTDAKTVTLTGVTAQTYEAGSDVVCLTSNIEIFGTGPGDGQLVLKGNGRSCVIRAAVHDFRRGFDSTPGHCRNNTFDGPHYELQEWGVQGSSNVFCGTFRAASGTGNLWCEYEKNHILAPTGLVYGTYKGAEESGEGGFVLNGRISNCQYGILKSAVSIRGLVLERNTYNMYSAKMGRGGIRGLTIRQHNQGFTAMTTRFVAHDVTLTDAGNDFITAPGDGDTADFGLQNWYKFYNFTDATATYARYKRMIVGTIKTDATPPAAGPTVADEWTFTSTICPLYWDEKVNLAPGQKVRALMWAYKAQAMDQEFTLRIVDPDTDPFDLYVHEPTRTGDTYLDETVMTAGTATWEKLSCVYVNNGTADKEVIIRQVARDASGTGHSLLEWSIGPKRKVIVA